MLSTTIDKYCYLTARWLPPFFTHRHRVVWSHVETVSQVGEILHPAVREGLRLFGFDDRTGIEIHHQGDLPSRAGMGSSSAFAVGLLHALAALRGQMIGKHELALRAIELEQERLRDHVGSQDQVAAAYGGLNLIEFRTDGDIRVQPVTIGPGRVRELESRLLLFFTGTSRLATDVAADVVANLEQKEATLRRMRRMVDEAVGILCDGGLDDFGTLWHEAWCRKRELSSRVSSPVVEDVYARATKAGALGGKLLGAGGSGFMAFFVPPERQTAVVRALHGFLHVPFAFESEGSRLVYYGPHTQWPGLEATQNGATTGKRRAVAGGGRR